LKHEDFELIQKHTVDLFKLSADNLHEKSMHLPSDMVDFLNFYSDGIRELKRLGTERDKLYGQLYDFYRYQNNKSLKNLTEIEPYIKSNQKYYELCLQISDVEIQVKWFEEMVDFTKKLTYHFGNIATFEKMKRGEL